MEQPKVSVCIATKNGSKHIIETIYTAINQDYQNLEIVISENASSDNTLELVQKLNYPHLKIFTTKEDLQMGGNCNKLIDLATGDILVYLCDDDLLISSNIITEIVKKFGNLNVGIVGRWYYQFIDGQEGVLRPNNSDNIYQLADNLSGLAFRKSSMYGKFSNANFVEAVSMVRNVIVAGWDYEILPYYTTAVRIRQDNGSMLPITYVNSPMLNWINIVGKQKFVLTNYLSLVQIKNYGTFKALAREIWVFIKYRPLNLLSFNFWFIALGTLVIPKCILIPLVKWYKNKLLRY